MTSFGGSTRPRVAASAEAGEMLQLQLPVQHKRPTCSDTVTVMREYTDPQILDFGSCAISWRVLRTPTAATANNALGVDQRDWSWQ